MKASSTSLSVYPSAIRCFFMSNIVSPGLILKLKTASSLLRASCSAKYSAYSLYRLSLMNIATPVAAIASIITIIMPVIHFVVVFILCFAFLVFNLTLSAPFLVRLAVLSLTSVTAVFISVVTLAILEPPLGSLGRSLLSAGANLLIVSSL